MTLTAVKEAVRAACLRGGCPELAQDIHIGGDGGLETIIVRPVRALTDREAFAMCAAWLDGYQTAGVLICPGGWGTECEEGCERECIPNYGSEEIVLQHLEILMRPALWRKE